WLEVESKGSIFLYDDKDGVLIMKAHKNLSKEHQKKCARVKLGECLCGRAAKERCVQFADCEDAQHDSKYKGIGPHGHYCVPVLSSDKKVLGVVDLYVQERHLDDKRKEKFIKLGAQVLASIIERDKLKRSLAQAEKNAAIGTMAASVAHELRNPLGVISIVAYNLKKKLIDRDETLVEKVDMIIKKVDESDRIMNDLLGYLKLRETKRTKVNINKLLEQVVDDIANKKKEVKVTKNFGDLPHIKANQLQLFQVFLNMIKNAYEAITGEGEIYIGTSHDVEKELVEISIRDTGDGISEENKEKITDPFFTTKTGGTGLGLAISFRIIEEIHHGRIRVKSKEGEGAEFVVKIPIK
ncbi:MAG: GAF domain-containing protein, partial [Candidatus Omnitrophica bacterium]|nr:GAF domain-containing protein [Candidatus Omnitrophota bacterium]